MIRRRRTSKLTALKAAPAYDDFHEWVHSLPWVVERPYPGGTFSTASVRSFGVECEPLGLQRLWLLTGMQCEREGSDLGLAVIVPAEAANRIEGQRWGRRIAPMPSRHVLLTVDGSCFDRRQDVEALVLTAYGYAMSS